MTLLVLDSNLIHYTTRDVSIECMKYFEFYQKKKNFLDKKKTELLLILKRFSFQNLVHKNSLNTYASRIMSP